MDEKIILESNQKQVPLILKFPNIIQYLSEKIANETFHLDKNSQLDKGI